MERNNDVEAGKAGLSPVVGQTMDAKGTPADAFDPDEPCKCNAGWALFGAGWFFSPLWFVGACLPFCQKDRNTRRAAFGSGVMIIVWLVLVTVWAIFVLPNMRAASESHVEALMDALASLDAQSARNGTIRVPP